MRVLTGLVYSNPAAVFAVATLTPVVFLSVGVFLGGAWVIAACLYLTTVTYVLDELCSYVGTDVPPGVEFPAADALSILLGLLHVPLLFLAVAGIAGQTGLTVMERAGLFFGFGLYFGQVLFSNAHELIHRPSRAMLALGVIGYASCLYGHHATAHRYIHHRHVGSDKDPNTAPLGMGFWRYLPRAWGRAFVEGWQVETARARRRGGPWILTHAYPTYILISAATAWGMHWAFGADGVRIYVLLSAYAALQILLADYVQHYGLRRVMLPNGRLEPVGPQHSWNAPHAASATLTLNAPLHSNHHADPMVPYPALTLPAETDAPMLPASLPAMSTLALFPPLWRRVMDHRARQWRG